MSKMAGSKETRELDGANMTEKDRSIDEVETKHWIRVAA